MKQRYLNGGTDKYYTCADLVKSCVRCVVTMFPDHLFIEPSAGNGAFIEELKNYTDFVIGFDIAPEAESIIKADWFTIDPPENSIIVGNPPFGFAANMAIKFFNHAAKKAKAIAFIVPRSFQKDSIQDKLDSYFHLHTETVCPENSFLVEGTPYNVPCVFQIWVREAHARERQSVKGPNPWLEFTTKDKADFAIRRVGGRAGQVLEGVNYSESSTYFCREKVPGVKAALRKIDFKVTREKTAGVRSVSKSEIHKALGQWFNTK